MIVYLFGFSPPLITPLISILYHAGLSRIFLFKTSLPTTCILRSYAEYVSCRWSSWFNVTRILRIIESYQCRLTAVVFIFYTKRSLKCAKLILTVHQCSSLWLFKNLLLLLGNVLKYFTFFVTPAPLVFVSNQTMICLPYIQCSSLLTRLRWVSQVLSRIYPLLIRHIRRLFGHRTVRWKSNFMVNYFGTWTYAVNPQILRWLSGLFLAHIS